MTCCGDGSIVKGDGDVLLMWLLVVDVFFEVLIDKSTTMFMYIYSVKSKILQTNIGGGDYNVNNNMRWLWGGRWLLDGGHWLRW